MITCQLLGGLGNNIFQLATVYNLHKKYNVEFEIPNYLDRGLADKFNQSSKLEFKDLFENNFNYSENVKFNNYSIYKHTDISGGEFGYSDIPFLDNTCYVGYFQSEKYFSDFNIKKEFILNSNIRLNLKNRYKHLFNKKTIALQYRLAGDRVQQSVQHYHKNVSVDFYKKSLELIIGDNKGDYIILLFSDNKPLAINLLSGLDYNFIPIQNKNNVEDFILMSMCDYNIIGNSTFAWWAAYFNENDSMVVAPKTEWFGPGYKNFNKEDLFPKKWITL